MYLRQPIARTVSVRPEYPAVFVDFGRNRRLSGRITNNSDPTVAALLWSLIGGTEATGHEAEAKLQKKTQSNTRSVCVWPTWSTPRPRWRCVEASSLLARRRVQRHCGPGSRDLL